MFPTLFRLRRRESPWEVVDHKEVQPVPMFYDDEDIDILRLSETETRGKYIFDIQLNGEPNWRLHKALIFARQQLLDEVAKRDYNVLLLEGWCLTVLRKGKRHRLVVEYNGRGALASGKLTPRLPPFMELLGKA